MGFFVMESRCFFCKGRLFCGRPYCPISLKIKAQSQSVSKIKKDYQGESPNIFVGRFGYPNVNIGVLSVEEYKKHDEPKQWSKDWYSINQVIGLRSELINASQKKNVSSPRIAQNELDSKNFLNIIKNFEGTDNQNNSNSKKELTQDPSKNYSSSYQKNISEIAKAIRPANIEVSLSKIPDINLTFSKYLAPTNLSVELSSLSITANPKIPKATDMVSEGLDIKATDAIEILRKKGYDEYYIQKLISSGSLGKKSQRKYVPTRWAITATDDILGKKLIKEIADYKLIDYTLYFGGHMGNYYILMFFPSNFSYELYECSAILKDAISKTKLGYIPKYAHDFEGFNGRKDYAKETAGGYYAARLSILKKLKDNKKIGSCIAIRFVTRDYFAPLGVWVVREAVDKALITKPIRFDSKEEMISYAQRLATRKYQIDLKAMIKESRLLNSILKQRQLPRCF